MEVRGEPAGAGVLLDGRPVGQVPVTVPDVAPGQHHLQVVRGTQAEEHVVIVEPGKPVVVDLQPQAAPAAPAAAPSSSQGGFPVRRIWAVFAGIPWGFMATTVAVVHVAAFALLWPLTPSQLPKIGGSTPNIDANTWKAIQWTPLAVAAAAAVVAVALFALPAIPVLQWLPQEATASPG